jgi:hypothetical protein
MVLFLVCLSWNVLLGPLLWWHRELFFGWNTVGANVAGVSENPDKITEQKRRKSTNVLVKITNDARGDKESPKNRSCIKSCEPLYTCPRAPFIGRRRDFYISKMPFNLRNIPNVNSYIDVFYISYMYKPATSSHVETLWSRNLRTWPSADSQISLTPNFRIS